MIMEKLHRLYLYIFFSWLHRPEFDKTECACLELDSSELSESIIGDISDAGNEFQLISFMFG